MNLKFIYFKKSPWSIQRYWFSSGARSIESRGPGKQKNRTFHRDLLQSRLLKLYFFQGEWLSIVLLSNQIYVYWANHKSSQLILTCRRKVYHREVFWGPVPSTQIYYCLPKIKERNSALSFKILDYLSIIRLHLLYFQLLEMILPGTLLDQRT